MTVIRRSTKSTVIIPATVWIFILLFVIVVFLALLPGDTTTVTVTTTSTTTTDDHNDHHHHHHNIFPVQDPNNKIHEATVGLGQKLRQAVLNKRNELSKALDGLTANNLPQRLKLLRDRHEIIGERLIDIQQGKETVEEIIHGHQQNIILKKKKKKKKKKIITNQMELNAVPNQTNDTTTATAATATVVVQHVKADQPPMTINDVITYLDNWIHQLHETLGQVKHATHEGIWQAYHDLTVKTLYPWDQDYLRRMPSRRDDGSIFLSLASYRDEHCYTTLHEAYEKAYDPDQLFVGLIQQNCHDNCKSGILKNVSTVNVPPDDDCYELFCSSDIGKERCSQIRLLNIDEPESLGPYVARYFASKLWNGESWFMQIDAHMTFKNNWDLISIRMLNRAPSQKPILSHYPPTHTYDFNKEDQLNLSSSRLCGPIFATSDLENQIIRLEGGTKYDEQRLNVPAFAPFTAAGYFVSHSDMLREVPFDPFLPWIFMGEEIIMSSRLWTSGYDIFSPTESVVGHWYVRRNKPKFWESVHRAFSNGIHNPLQMMILDRIKYQLGYPEADVDMIHHRSILTAIESYTMGNVRSLQQYLQIVGIDVIAKQIHYTEWCEKGYPPPGFEQHNHLYPLGMAKKTIYMKLDDNNNNNNNNDDWGEYEPNDDDGFGGGEDD